MKNPIMMLGLQELLGMKKLKEEIKGLCLEFNLKLIWGFSFTSVIDFCSSLSCIFVALIQSKKAMPPYKH